MERYRNKASGVKSYQIGLDYIVVKFNSSKIYKYSYARAGRHKVERMKALAIRGRGLNSYINRYAKYSYD